MACSRRGPTRRPALRPWRPASRTWTTIDQTSLLPLLAKEHSVKRFSLSALIALAAAPALAQTSVDGEYYVVRDPATRKCRVVDERPAVAADMVGRGSLKTWAEAEKG